MSSLQQRLDWGLGGSLIILLLLQWLLVSLFIRDLAESYVASRLAHDGESLLAALDSRTDGPLLDPAAITPIYRQPFSGHYYRIDAGDTTFFSRSLWDEEIPATTTPVGEIKNSRGVGPQDQPLLLVTASYLKQGSRVTITTAEDLTLLETSIVRFQLMHALISAAALGILLLVQRVVVGRALLPLEKVRQELANLEQGKVETIDNPVPIEIAPLVAEINHLVRLVSLRLQRSRSAVGNLAHALKTPLSLVRQSAESQEVSLPPAFRKQLLQQADIIGERIDRELRRARLAGATAPGSRFDPEEELPHLISAVKSIYREKGLVFESNVIKGKRFNIDRDDMLELAGNLLDNAAKWSRARIRFTVREENGLLFIVEDDGPGTPPERAEKLARRGYRLDEASPGHGLGLSIVRDIVDDYGGTLDFSRSEKLGGFQAQVMLPVASITKPS